LNFSEGINVIIGENGCGKTTILKCIYSASQCSNDVSEKGPAFKVANYFSVNAFLGNLTSGVNNGEFIVKDEDSEFIVRQESWSEFVFGGKLKEDKSIFIPTTEMLSHSHGFLALNQKYKLPFDGTQVDIIVNASLPETREIPSNLSGILEKISEVIDGTVVMEDDVFYVIKSDGRKIEFSLEAEGLRKLGLIWKLISNGLLEHGSLLLWDEPEANLNPELYPIVANILVELQKNGVQVFVATHSYNLAKYIEIKTYNNMPATFFALYRNNEKIIKADMTHQLEGSKNNPIINAENVLLDSIL
jgi:predicted ATPase